MTEVIQQLPPAAAGFIRKYRSLVMLSLAALGAVALIWRFARR